jgi:hypothetical protein
MEEKMTSCARWVVCVQNDDENEEEEEDDEEENEKSKIF